MTTIVNNLIDRLNLTSRDKGVPLKEATTEEVTELRGKFEKAGQAQVFAFYDDIKAVDQARLYEQLCSIDPDYVNEITHKALHSGNSSDHGQQAKLEPLPESATASVLDSQSSDIEKWYDSGLDLIADNKVAVVLMAGGQGTRLGSSAPKGCFNIGLPSEKSLFQIQAERIWKVQQLAGKKHGKKNVEVPWYVMTSGPTRAPTEKFFQEHDYFGLQKDNVMIFEQGVLPCITHEGKILLETKSKVVTGYTLLV